jgi:large subunit ribosomal protein L13
MYIKSFSLKSAEIKSNFLLLDCKDLVLGRVATAVADLLKGKHKVDYTPHILCGDKVILINVKQITITGDKRQQKIYRKYTGYMGGLKEVLYKNMKSTDTIKHAIKGMLNKGPQRNQLMKNLYVYEDEQHLQQAQKPQIYNLINKG